MLIFPAIDLYRGSAVRLYQGEYSKMTVYSDRPWELAERFCADGATCLHLVDLEGAKDGTAPNLDTVRKILSRKSLFCEVGGGIRSEETVCRYLDAGVDRVILGTAAVTDEPFLCRMVERYREKIAVGVDIKDGRIAIRGWTETADTEVFAFCDRLQEIGVRTLICTDVSKDGTLQGTNRSLYRQLSERFSMQIVASGGISGLEDIRALRKMDLYAAIVGKAYYTGAISIREAIEVAK